MPPDAPSVLGHALTFRVMRLAKPTFCADQQLLFSAEDLGLSPDEAALPELAEPALEKLLSPTDGKPRAALGGALLLPQSFGSIHLGETFGAGRTREARALPRKLTRRSLRASVLRVMRQLLDPPRVGGVGEG